MPCCPKPHLLTIKRRRGFTLVELSMAMGVTAILLVGMAAAMRMTVSAADTDDSDASRRAALQTALDQIRTELGEATALASLTDRSISMTVPDRNGDGSPETIEYAWDGARGGTCHRIYNGARSSFLTGVRSVSITDIRRSPPSRIENAEAKLASCEFTALLSDEMPINNTAAVSVFFRLAGVDGVESWRLTLARISIRKAGLLSSGTVTASLYLAGTNGKPTGSSLGSASATVNGLLSSLAADWIDFPISIAGLDPKSAYCLVLTGSGGTSVAQASIRSSGGVFNTHVIKSNNAGSTWSSPNDSDDLRYQVYGQTTTLVERD